MAFRQPILIRQPDSVATLVQAMKKARVTILDLRASTTVIGSQSACTNGNLTWFPLPGGIQVAFTGSGTRASATPRCSGRGCGWI